jgi:NitT/TauT family transport system substrate-binding protein
MNMVSKKILLLLVIAVIFCAVLAEYFTTQKMTQEKKIIRLAVEFTDHASCAFIAKHRGLFEAEGLNVTTFECYVTGPALAAALARGDIDAAYICLIPAISAYANAGTPIKVVAGTHKYGYALVVNQSKVKTVRDLEDPSVRIACPNKGSPPDVLLHKVCEDYQLDEGRIFSRVQYMNPPSALIALETGAVDAAFLPEQYPTMAEELGFKVLLTAQEVWPEMQGSVLVVKESLIKSHPEVVERLVKVTLQATQYIRDHPGDAARAVAEELQALRGQVLPSDVAEISSKLNVTPEVILKSLAGRVVCSNDINASIVQDTINYMAKLGYIREFNAGEILDLSFLKGA